MKPSSWERRRMVAREAAEATNVGDRGVSQGVPKPTSEIVIPTLPTQDGATLKSRQRQRSPDLGVQAA